MCPAVRVIEEVKWTRVFFLLPPGAALVCLWLSCSVGGMVVCEREGSQVVCHWVPPVWWLLVFPGMAARRLGNMFFLYRW